ncbi:MAG: hypothetical protein ACRD0E_04930, partial [Acidimicrobiales bacterium]
MSVRVEWVVYGRGAVESLRSTIKTAKGGDPLRPVTVVVPSNHVGVATRRLLGSGTLGPIAHRGIGLVAVNFLTPYRVADLLGSARLAGQGRRPVSAPVIGAALRAALGQAPGVFASVATHPATEMALLSAYRELRDLSDGALDNLSRAGTRSLDVVSLHRDARRCLAQDFYDEEDLIEAAIYVLGANPSYSDSFGAVVVYLPQQVSRHGGRLLAALAGQGEMVVLAGTTGDDRADRDVVRCLERMGADRASGDRPIDHDPLSVVGADRSTILTASDSDEEVRAAVRAVIDSARQGKALDRMAILYASANPYARLIHEHLSAAGIRYNGSAVVPLAARMAGRSLLGLLALPEGGYRRDDVFAWLSAARLHYQDKAIPVAAWERVSRQGGVVSGRDQWDRRLSTLADDLEAQARAHAQAAAVDADEPSWRAESLRADASLSRDLREFVLGIIGDLAQVAGDPRPWSAMSKWAGDRVDSLLDPGSGREHWPSAELKAAERLHRALERLACLDAMEATVTLEVFTRTLELELDTDLGRVGRMGQGLLVGPVAMGVGLDLDLVIVLGLAEGLFPSQIQEDSLLPDDDRAQAGAELGLRSWSVERQHRHLLAALAGAKEQLLCVPRGDLRQSLNRMPSR